MSKEKDHKIVTSLNHVTENMAMIGRQAEEVMSSSDAIMVDYLDVLHDLELRPTDHQWKVLDKSLKKLQQVMFNCALDLERWRYQALEARNEGILDDDQRPLVD